MAAFLSGPIPGLYKVETLKGSVWHMPVMEAVSETLKGNVSN